MTSIYDQSYQYFLTEAQDLLQVIETELFGLGEDYSMAAVHSLMRATHTLKGAAANVRQETIKKISHYLEDVFRALLSPEAIYDQEVESLLFQGYECLRLALSAELTGEEIDESEVLNRAAAVFAGLQEKLGECFDQHAPLPTSAELGFDITKSIFEVGVKQRLDELDDLVDESNSASLNPNVIAQTTQEHAEVFLGLAESLSLPGFKAIAEKTLAALKLQPEKAIEISKIALVDFQRAHANVLAGDREQGGNPSAQLQKLAGVEVNTEEITVDSKLIVEPESEATAQDWQLSVSEDLDLPTQEMPTELELNIEQWDLASVDSPIDLEQTFSNLELSAQLPDTELEEEAATPQEVELSQWDFAIPEDNLEEEVATSQEVELSQWDFAIPEDNLEEEVATPQEVELSQWDFAIPEDNLEDSLKLPADVTETDLEQTFGSLQLPDELDNPDIELGTEIVLEPNTTPETTVETAQNQALVPTPQVIKPQPIQPTPSSSHRTKNKKATPRAAKISPSVRVNLEQLEQLNQLISELKINQNQLTLRDEQFQASVRKLNDWLQQHRRTIIRLRDEISQYYLKDLRQGMGNHPIDILLHSALEETVQLEQAKDDINFLADYAAQAVEKEERLLHRVQEDMQSVRMIPIGSVLNRFPPMVQQLANVNQKPVELQVSGTEVLVDKTITESLYDALLHLVRNAFDHGIEPEERRRSLDKPKTGQIRINAFNQGNRTIIELSDDGRGLNLERILERAVEQELLEPSEIKRLQQLPEPANALLELLCQPGFSTASQVSDLSGRGIGLDVVASQVGQINGILRVNSVTDVGTTFSIQIQGALISSRLMVCQADSSRYAFVSNEIEQVLIPTQKQIKILGERKVLKLHPDEDAIALYQLSSMFPYSSTKSDIRQNLPLLSSEKAAMSPLLIAKQEATPILLLRIATGLVGLEIDKVIEEQELVIKPIPEDLNPPSYVYGCTILADSSLTLVIDGSTLIEQKYSATATSTSQSQFKPEINYPQPSNEDGIDDKQLESGTKTFLIVDDSITERHTLSQILLKTGNQVIQARDGVEALEQLHQNPGIDLVVCDLEMPRMNGFEFLSSTAQDSSTADIPIVMLTSRSTQQYKQIAKELGAAAYLTKPYLEQELLTTMNEILNN